MHDKWIRLASDLLEAYNEHLGNQGCNDWSWPADWSVFDKAELVKEIYGDDAGLDEVVNFLGEYGPADFEVVGFLATKLREMVKPC